MRHKKFYLIIKTSFLVVGIKFLFVHNVFGQDRGEEWIYPQTKIEDAADTFHGVKVNDPYRWLEDMKSEKVIEWTHKQDGLLKQQLHLMPVRERIRQRIEALSHYSLYTIPQKAGGKYFYLKTPAGKAKPILYTQDGLNHEPKILIDLEKELTDSLLQFHTTSAIPGFYASPDGEQVAYCLSNGSSRWFTIKIRGQKKDYEETLEGLHNAGNSCEWIKTSKGFFYVKYDLPDKKDLLKAPAKNPAVYFHKTGSSQSQDDLIYKKNEGGHWSYSLKVTDDGRYLVIDARDGSKIENQIFVKEIDSKTTLPLLVNEDANYTFLGNAGNDFFFYTNLKASKGRIVRVNLTNQNMDEIIAEAEEAISGGSAVGGNALGFFDGTFVITYIKAGIPFIKGFTKEGRYLYTSKFPIDGSIWGGFVGRSDDAEVFYQFLGFTDPSTIYKMDAKTGQTQVFKRSEQLFDSKNYITEQVFYTSKDGTKIPMFVSHRKDIKLDGNNPAFIYAYGAFSWISFLFYQQHLLVWMEMGGVYAQPSVRGGGEFGESWHRAGVGRNRQNAVDDYIGASEWLIQNKYTSADKLVANGGSLSGSLAGAAMIQRPDLFGACILDRPPLDMIRYDRFTTGSAWVDELGHPDDPEDFKVLFKLSPYHQIQPDSCYPPTLIMAGEEDQVAPPLHAYKFTAALQSTKTCHNMVLLKMMWGAGHSFGNTPQQITDSRTDEITFLVKVLKLKY